MTLLISLCLPGNNGCPGRAQSARAAECAGPWLRQFRGLWRPPAAGQQPQSRGHRDTVTVAVRPGGHNPHRFQARQSLRSLSLPVPNILDRVQPGPGPLIRHASGLKDAFIHILYLGVYRAKIRNILSYGFESDGFQFETHGRRPCGATKNCGSKPLG